MASLEFFDPVQMNDVITKIDNNMDYYQELLFTITDAYSNGLDNLMQRIVKEVVEVDQPPLSVLEKYYLELSNALYFISEKLERLGVYDSISKNLYKEAYNNNYLVQAEVGETKKKPTVAEITANAENNTIYENVINDIYAKAYKIVKTKVDSANTMLSCIGKIINRRMIEMQLTSVTPTNKRILNEDVNIDLNSTGNGYTIPPSSFSNTYNEF